jgi:dethiobiotin synthetase
MKAIFVAGAGTDIGKTYVSAGLLRCMRAHGQSARALKPVMSGFDPARAAESDAGRLLAALGRPATAAEIAAIAPFRYAAPLAPDAAARREGRTLMLDDILLVCRDALAAPGGPLLIEGVGGVMSPIARDATGLDLARALGLPVLLVAGTYLGAISHALTAALAVRGAGLEIAALVVNESAVESVGVAETLDALGRFAPDIPITTIERDAPTEAFAAVARACRWMD